MSQGWRHFPFAEVVRAVDGDTLEVVVDQGFEDSTRIRVRLAYIDAPEKVGESRAWGNAAALKLDIIGSGQPCEVWTRRPSFGRYEGFVLVEDAGDLGAWMIQNGYARAWDHEREELRPWVSYPINGAETTIELHRYELILAARLEGEPRLMETLNPAGYIT